MSFESFSIYVFALFPREQVKINGLDRYTSNGAAWSGGAYACRVKWLIFL
jgi:hypothetical protein